MFSEDLQLERFRIGVLGEESGCLVERQRI
jgi:hypothetical protein